MDDYEITFHTWNQLADWYQNNIMTLDIYDQSYHSFCERFSNKDAAILEIGCGPGNVSKQLLQINPKFNILATDISENMLTYAKKNNPNCAFQLLDIRAIGQLKKQFDGIVAGFCLPYLSKQDTIQLLKNARHLLHKNGILYVSCIEGDYEKSGMVNNSKGLQSLMFYYESDFLISQLNAQGFGEISIERILYPNVKEPTATHLVLIAKKI